MTTAPKDHYIFVENLSYNDTRNRLIVSFNPPKLSLHMKIALPALVNLAMNGLTHTRLLKSSPITFTEQSYSEFEIFDCRTTQPDSLKGLIETKLDKQIITDGMSFRLT